MCVYVCIILHQFPTGSPECRNHQSLVQGILCLGFITEGVCRSACGDVAGDKTGMWTIILNSEENP
jgi:coenzyme F420-reducing hydrogenase gamma subunit